jgi:dihydrofolate reductase
MRKVIVNEFMSLDGVVQAPGDADEDRDGGFEHGGWHLRYFDDLSQTRVLEGIVEAGGFLLGRRTYEIFAAYWPNAPADDRFSARERATAKLIYSAIASLDGYVADADGNFDWAEPDEEVHAFVNDLERPVGTYLYGRRLYEVRSSGRRPRRSSTRRHWRPSSPPGRGSSAASTRKRSGG